MYDPVIKDKAQWLGQVVTPKNPQVVLPDALRDWLIDLRLLRYLPLAYLVPDPALLPPESARFFYVDPTFTDRLVDGALAAGNLGTMDQAFSMEVMVQVRSQIDQAIAEMAGVAKKDAGNLVLTGMLLRSVVVKRWPRLKVLAFHGPPAGRPPVRSQLTVLRQEVIAPGVMIAIIGGIPTRVEVHEPREGTQFGVEEQEDGTFKLDPRDEHDAYQSAFNVKLRDKQYRTLDLDDLREQIANKLGKKKEDIESSWLALSLQRVPYIQVFEGQGLRPGILNDTHLLEVLVAAIAKQTPGGK